MITLEITHNKNILIFNEIDEWNEVDVYILDGVMSLSKEYAEQIIDNLKQQFQL